MISRIRAFGFTLVIGAMLLGSGVLLVQAGEPPPLPASGPAGGVTATPTATGDTPTVTPTSTPPPGVSPTATVVPGCTPAWHPVAGPPMSELNAVAAVGAADVWAVGDQILHWNGLAWTSVPFATPTVNPLNPIFYGVAAGAANSVWAVGGKYRFQGDLIEHWDGTAWTELSGQSSGDRPAVTLFNLTGVSALNANEAYAVGAASVGTVATGSLYRCSTTTCTYLTGLTGPSFGGFSAVAALTSTDVWLLGSFGGASFAGHWDGSTLTQFPLAGHPGALAALSSTDIWAVGDDTSQQSLIYHWNGTSWLPVSSPNIGSLSAVSARTANDIWAVSITGGSLHWDGTTWTPVVTSNAIPLEGVVSIAPADVWAVGSDTQSVILHYAAEAFADVSTTHPFYPYVQWMACRTYISGYPCGGPGEPCPGSYFRPGNPVTRGQLLKMVVNAAAWPVVTPPAATFEDVPPGSTFFDYIESGVSHGVISGYPCGGVGEPCVAPGNRPYFRPNNNVTRGQISKVVALARSYPLPTPTVATFEDVPPGSTFFSYVEAVYAQGIVVGYPCGTNPSEPCVAPGNRPYFRPGNNATRGQVSKIVTIAYGGP